MFLPKELRPLAIFTGLYIVAFALYALVSDNIEFLFYVSIVVIVFVLLLKKQSSFSLPKDTLWGLSVWGLLHMMGGNIPANGSVLYNLWIIPDLLKYDQFVHLFGFAVATILGFDLLKPMLTNINRQRLFFLLVMIGLGLGALNEIIEFVAVLTIPETNVEGYFNTGWDLVFDLYGAIIACVYIAKRRLS